MTHSRPYLRSRLLRFASLLAVLLLGSLQLAHGQTTPVFTDLVIFGDSLSDVGNIADQAQSQYGVRYPGSGPNGDFNYTDGSFTDGDDTQPKARAVLQVWHRQLAKQFLHIDAAEASLDGGFDYAFGGAKTIAGTTDRSVLSEGPFTSSLTIDNMGKQVSTYLDAHTPSATSLYIVWGGGNDLFDDPSATDVAQTALNIGHYVNMLAKKGARSFLVPNVPPLGMVPNYNTKGDDSTIRNQASADYKDALNGVLDRVTARLARKGIPITVYRLDVYSLFLDFINNPLHYGYVNVTDPSQGLDVNPDKYLFWDGVHPTTTGHYYLAAAAYSLISGQPVLSVTAPTSEVKAGDGVASFYINQVGGDATATLQVPYTVSGSATPALDYNTLPGMRMVKAGHRAVRVKLQTLANPALKDPATVVLTLDAGAGYALGLLNTSTIIIDPSSGN